MSMLRSFFEIGADESLFDGLYISKNKALCEEYLSENEKKRYKAIISLNNGMNTMDEKMLR